MIKFLISKLVIGKLAHLILSNGSLSQTIGFKIVELTDSSKNAFLLDKVPRALNGRHKAALFRYQPIPSSCGPMPAPNTEAKQKTRLNHWGFSSWMRTIVSQFFVHVFSGLLCCLLLWSDKGKCNLRQHTGQTQRCVI